MTGTPATGSMWRRGARNSFILAFLENRWCKRFYMLRNTVVAFWLQRMDNGASAGCSDGTKKKMVQRHGYALFKNQLVKRALDCIWNFVCGISVPAVNLIWVCLPSCQIWKVCWPGWWENEGWRELWVPARQIAVLCFFKTFVEYSSPVSANIWGGSLHLSAWPWLLLST